MPLIDALFQTATINSVTYGDAGERIKSPVATNIKTRIEHSQRLVVDKTGTEVLARHLFFFLPSEIANIQPDYVIDFGSNEYVVIKADLLIDFSADHHWEVFAR